MTFQFFQSFTGFFLIKTSVTPEFNTKLEANYKNQDFEHDWILDQVTKVFYFKSTKLKMQIKVVIIGMFILIAPLSVQGPPAPQGQSVMKHL